MGTWPLWIAFNAGVALFLLLDLAVIHRRATTISLRAAALESVAWIALSLGFGAWIYVAHGRGPGLEFFTGYVVEKSLSADNVFVFLLVFQYFRVQPKFQHRLLYWGVLGAIVLRGAMIGAGDELITRFAWTPYLLGIFLLYSGSRLFGADHAVHPEKNPLLRWAKKILPMSDAEPTGALFVRESGRWLFTSLFLVLIVLETTDLVLAVDSIAAVFGVTRDPFLVYTSNICAILGLRALYFLLAGVLPYFQYLDEGLAITVMFIGAKMLAAPWVHISTGLSLVIVGGIIAVAVITSAIRKRLGEKDRPRGNSSGTEGIVRSPTMDYISQLAEQEPRQRLKAAESLFREGTGWISTFLAEWIKDEEFYQLVVQEQFSRPYGAGFPTPVMTVGVAVLPDTFEKVREANGSPPLADAPEDQDVIEFELHFQGDFVHQPRLDILTTKAPGGEGAIARFLRKFGEGIQQVEIDVKEVDRGAAILRTRFNLEPIYPETRPGANGTRVNFFLVARWNNKKVLVELVEQPKGLRQSPITSH